MQAVRDKEKAGIQHIDSENLVVYTEFGPESAPSYEQSIASMNHQNNSTNHNNNSQPYQHHHHVAPQKTNELTYQIQDTIKQHPTKENLHELDSTITNPSNDTTYQNEISQSHQTKSTNQSAINNNNNTTSPSTNIDAVDGKLNAITKDIEKISIAEKQPASKATETNNEKNQVKANNQKNKESQPHHFFPKFRSSSHSKDNKEKDKDSKEKDKEKESNKNDDEETKTKPKKGLNFFRRNKSSSAQTPASPKNTNDKIIIDNNDNKFKKFEELSDDKPNNLVELASVSVGSGNATAAATVVAK